jgi:excisionase family DNA binding protein
MRSLTIELPDEVLELIAERAAELVAARQAPTAAAWLDTKGAAEHLACSTARIHDLVQARALRPRRDGRRLLFKRSELDDYLEGSA